MGGGDKGILNLSCLRHHHHHSGGGGLGKKQAGKEVPPKGYLAIKVGGQGEQQQRFVVPVLYLNHPLFVRLLKEAEEEYGFDQKGAITIPCHVEEFQYVQGMIDKQASLFHRRRRDHRRPIAACFRL
ncbi:hypothetical protein Nepgr_024366 [Nepenthes gracilis]|uniref:Uncharacterized protein n=1 Tax=Nepenthes gracilis TaxID=150966 RepID=A0AAD3T3V7_NEPGR|nr:hypothetical protein Nepgr_024366 [Nepenthes gracilis]